MRLLGANKVLEHLTQFQCVILTNLKPKLKTQPLNLITFRENHRNAARRNAQGGIGIFCLLLANSWLTGPAAPTVVQTHSAESRFPIPKRRFHLFRILSLFGSLSHQRPREPLGGRTGLARFDFVTRDKRLWRRQRLTVALFGVLLNSTLPLIYLSKRREKSRLLGFR